MGDRCVFCRLYNSHAPERIAIKYNDDYCICKECLKLGTWVIKTLLEEVKKELKHDLEEEI